MNQYKTINLLVFGIGNVGGALINQILNKKEAILKRQKIDLNIVAISNSKQFIFNTNGISTNWKKEIEHEQLSNDIPPKILNLVKKHQLKNIIAIDNTADVLFTQNYIPFVNAGFNLVSSNKIGNTLSFDFYKELRLHLKKHNKTYLYETNVGAGLPVIDTINLLHEAGDNVTRIRGVFSGSLSYLFNNFSSGKSSFSEVLKEAINKGYTEPDPREDLSGNDVARKLLILARELDLKNEFEDINITNLVNKELQSISTKDFLNRIHELNDEYHGLKNSLKEGEVLRYIGDLHGDLFQEKGILEVKLVTVSVNSPLGSLKGSDALFEIYTESYGNQPIVIQGAGAGAQVTARGVFGDILRIAKKELAFF